jgi:O-methyltransferase involved in polyketide biosynthesis
LIKEETVGKLRVADLPPVARTLLVPLACRADESRRPDAMIRDDRAREILSRFEEEDTLALKMGGTDRTFTMMRARQFDRYARAFLGEQPGGMVVDIGCGLDTRSSRVDDGRRLWLGLDLPEVIAVRRTLIPEGPRERLLGGSVTDPAWMDGIAAEKRPAIFIAEGVFPYFEPGDVRRLIVNLSERFPGSELAFDALSWFSIRLHSLHPVIRKTGARLGWGMDDGREIEAWSPRIHLLEAWNYFKQKEPRLGIANLMRFIPPLANANFIARYRLG